MTGDIRAGAPMVGNDQRCDCEGRGQCAGCHAAADAPDACVAIPTSFAVDLAYHLLYNADDRDAAEALHDSLVRTVNASRTWHVLLREANHG